MLPNVRSLLVRPATVVVAAGCAAVLVAGCGTTPSTDAAAASAPAVRVELVPVAATVALAATSASTRATTGLRAGKVRAYGDSVMLGAASALRSRLHAKVDAAVSRQSYTLLSLVRRDWARGRIHGPVVIHTGTNGTVLSRDLIRTIRPIQKQHLVLLVNVKLPSRYTWTGSNNRVIAGVDHKWTNVISFDWHKLGARHPRWFGHDGTHLTTSGAKAYARGVAKRLGR